MQRSERIRTQALGLWDSIILDVSPHLAHAVERAPSHVICPVHGGSNGDGFRLFEDFHHTGGGYCNTCGGFGNGINLVKWANNLNYRGALDTIDSWLRREGVNMTGEVAAMLKRVRNMDLKQKTEEAIPDNLERIREMLKLSRPIEGTLGQKYLEKRLGQTYPFEFTSDLRFIDELGYSERVNGDNEYVGSFPAILAILRSADGRLVTVQRTYLNTDGTGKAPIKTAKKTMPLAIRNVPATCRLAPFGESLAVAEGLETALAFRILTGIPTWMTAGTSWIAGFTYPAGIKNRYLARDLDTGTTVAGAPPGEKQARELQKRYPDMKPQIPHHHDLKGKPKVDFCDILLRRNNATRKNISRREPSGNA